MWDELAVSPWPHLAAIVAALDLVLIVIILPWVLAIKREPAAAVAWCLLVLLVPLLGALLFYQFGYQSVHRPLSRKRSHRRSFRLNHPVGDAESEAGQETGEPDHSWEGMARLATRLDAFPPTTGNSVRLFHDGPPAYEAMYEAIRRARHHVHAEFYIVQPDETGQEFIALLTEKARSGVEVRLLYDAIGSYGLHRRLLAPLRAAGGRTEAFLPIHLLRRRFQINLRNHRKILVTDGQTAFTGGLNIGSEYLSKSLRFGYWRDTHLAIEGPAVSALQRIFAEDWDFASGEHLKGMSYFPTVGSAGTTPVQVVASGPDQALKSIREIYFAAILRARRTLWIASPYFVPDAGLLDALCLAGRSGVDVRLLTLYRPDHWLPFLAGRYYFPDVMDAGVKVYLYSRGMMHAKVILVDGAWASVGSANLDNRSLHLNFEANCLFNAPAITAELERQFQRDLGCAIRLDPDAYARRPLSARLGENVARLFAPVL